MRFAFLTLLSLLLLALSLVYGAVEIPPESVWQTIVAPGEADAVWRLIVLESRLPMALASIVSGAALAVAGLLLQTTFQNPLAGPSILGVSSGASMGVAVVMLFGAGAIVSGAAQYLSIIGGAIAGAAAVMLLLIFFSSILKSSAMLLIAGIMIGYLTSSVISLLNYFAPSDDVKSFVVWGLGSFAGVGVRELPVFLGILVPLTAASILFAKPLNALLLGERYASNMGYSVPALRTWLLGVSGVLTAIVTAFCGPIGFIGLVVPHIARMLFRTSNHFTLIPATMLTGGLVTLLCNLLTVFPGKSGVLPVNAITPLIGVPVIIDILVNRRKLKYFN